MSQLETSFRPPDIKNQIIATYGCFGSALAFATTSAVATFFIILNTKTASGEPIDRNNNLLPIALILMIKSGEMIRNMEYKGEFGARGVAWIAYAVLTGGLFAAIIAYVDPLNGGPYLIQTAWLTLAIVAGLTIVAFCSPSEMYFFMGDLLDIAVPLLFACSVFGIYISPTTVIGSGLHNFLRYGKLVISGAFLLFNTQVIRSRMQTTSHHDPLNESLLIYMHTIEIFTAVLTASS